MSKTFDIENGILIKYRGTEAEVLIPSSVKKIDMMAFQQCTSLTTIELPKNIASIEETSFRGCDKLTFTVSKGSYAEDYCKKLGLKYKAK